MMRSNGLLVMLVGVGAIVVGLLIYAGALSWFGRLPGDIRYEGGRTRVYAPFASMLLLSLVVSLVLYLLRRFL
jgi:ABC-type transporter Mla subunit MlaD